MTKIDVHCHYLPEFYREALRAVRYPASVVRM